MNQRLKTSGTSVIYNLKNVEQQSVYNVVYKVHLRLVCAEDDFEKVVCVICEVNGELDEMSIRIRNKKVVGWVS